MKKDEFIIKRNVADLPQIFIDHNQPDFPIVYVHGYNSSHANPHLEFAKIYDKHDYYAFTFPGCNKTEATPEELSVRYYARLLIKFIEEKQLKNVILFGHSMGGTVIGVAYGLRPDLFSKLVFIAPMNRTSLVLNPLFYEFWFPQNFDQYRELIRFMSYDKTLVDDPNWVVKNLGNDFDFDLYNNSNIKALGETLPDLKLMDEMDYGLSIMKVPTLVLLGEIDGCVLRDETKEYFNKMVPHAKVVIMEKCGHSPFKDDMDYYKNIIDDFLEKN